MDVKKTIDYWSRSADYDLEVAESLFEKRKYHYALFFDHLAIEKILKGIFVKQKLQHAPISHSLPILAQKAELELDNIQLKKLARFMEFYLEGRYPKDLDAIFQKYDKNNTRARLDEMKEMYRWLAEKL